MNKAGIASFDAEIAKIDQQLRDNQDNFTKLDQVVASALKWVEDKKATVDINAIPCGWSHELLIDPTPEELAKLTKNDRYIIVTLRMVATRDGDNVQFDPTVRIADAVKGKSSFMEDIQNELNLKKEELENAKKAKLAMREVSVSAFNSIGNYVKGWTIYRIDQSSYSVRGPGLGWAGKIIDGQWVYRLDKNEMMPIDSPAITLRNILQVNF
jgi:hypothetical protein